MAAQCMLCYRFNALKQAKIDDSSGKPRAISGIEKIPAVTLLGLDFTSHSRPTIKQIVLSGHVQFTTNTTPLASHPTIHNAIS